MPIGTPIDPIQAGSTVGRQDRRRDEQRPAPGEQVAEVLADADAEQAVERREGHLDRPAGRLTLRALGAAT